MGSRDLGPKKSPNPEEVFLRKELDEKIEYFLGKMDKLWIEVYHGRMTVAQVAKENNYSERWARALWSLVKKDLAKHLKAHGYTVDDVIEIITAT